MRGLHWFRNDLRLDDNQGLAALAERAEEWLPVFVLDPGLLARNPVALPRTRFLLDCLAGLQSELASRGVPFQVLEGRPEVVLPRLARETKSRIVSWNRAPTPLGQRRDARVEAVLRRAGVDPLVLHDHTVFAPDEIRTRVGGRYSVYTPYRNAWWEAWHREPRECARRSRLPKHPIPGYAGRPSPALAASATRDQTRRLPRGGEKVARRRLASFLA